MAERGKNSTLRQPHKQPHGPDGKPLLSADAILALCEPKRRKRCGLYFLVKDGQIMYVGQSVHADARIASHEARDFDSWAFIECEETDLDHFERAYIDSIMPAWNMDPKTVRAREASRPPMPGAGAPAIFVPWQLSPEEKRVADENARCLDAIWTEDRIKAERMRRVRAARGGGNYDASALPEYGDQYP